MGGDDSAVEGAYRHARDDIRVDGGFLERPGHPALEGTQRAASLQDEHVLGRNVGQNEARPTELLLQVLDVGTVPDQRLYRRRLARGAAHREKCPWH